LRVNNGLCTVTYWPLTSVIGSDWCCIWVPLDVMIYNLGL